MLTFLKQCLQALAIGVFLIVMTSAKAQTGAGADGLVKVKSAYGVEETVARLKADIAAKGIRFFESVDQSRLAADAGIALRPSTLLVFGNPPLGAQFLTSNPYAGLDWPVRVLVVQEASGDVVVAYTDFAWIARRHHIEDRQAQFAMASQVVESITSSVRPR